MREIRRSDDDELCGFIDEAPDGWRALTVFGGTLGTFPTEAGGVAKVLADGLASLMDRWILVDHTDDTEQIVCIQEANPEAVTLALDYYSLPGVPTLRIDRTEFEARRWTLRPSL